MDKTEVMLKECIDDLLEEEIKAIPKDTEIKKQHKFSRQFEKNMNELIKENKRKNMFRIYRALGACAAVLVLGAIAVNGLSPYWSQKSLESNEEAAEEMAEMTTESAMDTAEDTSGANDSVMEYSDFSGVKSSYGDEVNVTDMKEEPVGLRVIAAYQQEDGWILYQQIQNNSQKAIQFMEGSYMLEVWQEDGWYVLSTKEESKVYELEPGSRYAGDIVLADELSAGNTYRLLCMFDGEIRGYVFHTEE